MSNEIVPGSLGSVAQSQNISIAESFMNADVVVLVDVSGSMAATDSRGGKQRYSVACAELAKLQNDLPGRVAVVAFSHYVEFVPNGVPPFIGGGTGLAEALRFVEIADGTVDFVVISDGQPDDERSALAEARKFKSKISCVFVGSESDEYARAFLQKLAQMSGGKYVVADKAHELADKVETLLLGPCK